MGAGDTPCLLRGFMFTMGWYLHCQEHPRREPEWHLMAGAVASGPRVGARLVIS